MVDSRICELNIIEIRRLQALSTTLFAPLTERANAAPLLVSSLKSLGIVMKYLLIESRSVTPEELNALFVAVGWGQHSAEQLQRSVNAYPFVAHARTDTGMLVGYVSAFSDEVFSTMLGELAVHPKYQRQGIAAKLLTRVEARFPSAPVYIKALGTAKSFFAARGYKAPNTELTVLFKKPTPARDA